MVKQLSRVEQRRRVSQREQVQLNNRYLGNTGNLYTVVVCWLQRRVQTERRKKKTEWTHERLEGSEDGSAAAAVIPDSVLCLRGSQWDGKSSVGSWMSRHPLRYDCSSYFRSARRSNWVEKKKSPTEVKQPKISVMRNSCHIWTAAGQRWALEERSHFSRELAVTCEGPTDCSLSIWLCVSPLHTHTRTHTHNGESNGP